MILFILIFLFVLYYATILFYYATILYDTRLIKFHLNGIICHGGIVQMAKYNNFGIKFECKPNTVHNLGYSISDANTGSSIVFVFTPFIQ